MAESFGVVVIAIAVVAALIACASYVGSGRLYRGIGCSGLSLVEPGLRPAPQPGSAAWQAEAETELRQLLDAKSARSEARGDGAIDVEAELARLSRRTRQVDPALRDEVRDLVVATNERRLRRGQPPLHVEAEVDRRLDDVGG